MKNKYKVSLLSMMVACIATVPAVAAVKVKNSNRSYADAYNQVAAVRYQQEYLNATTQTASTASATANLPVMVDDEKLANAILNNESEITMSKLDACAMIYPSGVFRWGIPESGVRRNQMSQCIAVVNLIDANTQEVLATTTVAAGDTMKCNIDLFPEYGMNISALSKIELPADAAPTMEDVEKVMDEEQKQNAGFKIAAGAIIAGVAGNILAPKEAGDTKLFGTGKTQLIDTAIGTATGAGIMAASTYSGKVAGDTIKSSAVNAASGMIVGNMMAGAAGGDTILNTTKCTVKDGDNNKEYDCVIGKISKKGAEIYEGAGKEKTTNHFFIINRSGGVRECNQNTRVGKIECVYHAQLLDVYLELNDGTKKSFREVFGGDPKGKDSFLSKGVVVAYEPDAENSSYYEKVEQYSTWPDNGYAVIASGYEKSSSERKAYAVLTDSKLSKAFGYTLSDWTKELSKKGIKYYGRNTNGTIDDEITLDDTMAFEPSTKDAEAGGLIDISNQSRAKGTIAGTAVGGAMGGFAGYQGAQSEITERWVSAVREYNDSLSKFACTTGGRYLSKYNDYLDIPELKEE